MGFFRRAVTEAADTIASVSIRTGRKVAGEKGADTANTLTGRRYARCSDKCTPDNHDH